MASVTLFPGGGKHTEQIGLKITAGAAAAGPAPDFRCDVVDRRQGTRVIGLDRDATAIARFGELTAAFTLQMLLP